MKPRHPRGFSLGPPRLSGRRAAAIWPRDGPVRCRGGPTAATMGEQEFGSVLGETTMNVFRLIAGVVGLVFVAAAATAVLGIGTEVRAEPSRDGFVGRLGLRARTVALRLPMADASGKTGRRPSVAAVLVLFPPPTFVEYRRRCLAHGGITCMGVRSS